MVIVLRLIDKFILLQQAGP